LATEIEHDDSLESSDTSVTEQLSLEKRILTNLERAIKKDNDVAIVQAWQPEYEEHEEYETLKQHLQRVRLAQRRLAALEQFRSALQTNDHEIIVKSFDPVLNGYPLVQSGEWERLSAAVRFVFSSCIIMIGQGTD
jgi:hypothetical protein